MQPSNERVRQSERPEWMRVKSADEVGAILVELRLRLERIYGERLRGLYLFGSYARGDAHPESDLDVLIVLDDFATYSGEVRRAGGVIAALSLEHTMSITPVLVSEASFHKWSTPFLVNVRNEGQLF